MIILPYNKSRISMKPFITFLQKQKLADNVDIFEKNVRNLFPLQYIKLQTAEKMYKTNNSAISK